MPGAPVPPTAQDKTIRVGITLRMMVESGMAYGDIAKTELEAVNAKGGINGAKVEVILLDDECKPDKGIANVNRFISQNKVHLIIGSTCSSVSMPIVDVTAKEQVPQIVPQSTNSSITQKGSEWVFRVSVSERFYAGVYGKYLGENVGKKIAYLYTTDGAGIAFTKQLQDYMKKTYNVEPVYEAQMQETDLDFRSHLLKIKSLNPEILAIAGQADALARQAQQSFEVGIPKSVWRVAASSAGNVTYPKLAGDAAVGTTFTPGVQLQRRAADREGVRGDGEAEVQVRAAPITISRRPGTPRRSSRWRSPRRSSTLTDASLADDRRAIRDALADDQVRRSCRRPDRVLRRADAAVPRRQPDGDPRAVHEGRRGLRDQGPRPRVLRQGLRSGQVSRARRRGNARERRRRDAATAPGRHRRRDDDHAVRQRPRKASMTDNADRRDRARHRRRHRCALDAGAA